MRRTVFSLLATAALLVTAAPPVLAASCQGASHAVTLSAGTVDPGSGTTATRFTFSVRYSSNAGCAPSEIAVVIPGAGTYPLTGNGSDYAAGVVFTRAVTLQPGVYTYAFTVTSGSGRGEQELLLSSVTPGSVTVTTPTPVPTPQPTPVPTPPPAAPAPVAPPPPTPAPTTPLPAQPTSPAQPGGSDTGVPPAPAESPAPTPDGSPGAAGEGGGNVDPSPSASDDAVIGGAGSVHDSWFGWPFGGGDSPNARTKPSLLPDGLVSSAVSLLSVSVTLALLLLGLVIARRRSDAATRQPAAAAAPPAQHADAAARPTAPALVLPVDETDPEPMPQVSPLPPMRELVPPVDASILAEDEGRAGPQPGEEGVPRWLRPSVRQARFANDRDVRRSSWG